MNLYPAIAVLALLGGTLSAVKARRLRRQLGESEYERANVTAKLESTEASYKALLCRANELSQEKVQANKLVTEVGRYIGGIKDQLKGILAVHYDMRRALERIASYQLPDTVDAGGVRERDRVHALMAIAKDALPGLTLAGTVEEVASRMTKPSPFYEEAQKALAAAGGVCADGTGKVKVDLSGQAARIKVLRKQVKETVELLQDGLARPLSGDPSEGPLAVAASRLGAEKLAVDLVKHGDTPGIAIVTENLGKRSGDPSDDAVERVQLGDQQAAPKPAATEPPMGDLDHGFLSPVGKE